MPKCCPRITKKPKKGMLYIDGQLRNEIPYLIMLFLEMSELLGRANNLRPTKNAHSSDRRRNDIARHRKGRAFLSGEWIRGVTMGIAFVTGGV